MLSVNGSAWSAVVSGCVFTAALVSQTHRELVKLSDGVGFRVHMIHKGAEAAKKFGPKSSKKYGESDPGERVVLFYYCRAASPVPGFTTRLISHGV